MLMPLLLFKLHLLQLELLGVLRLLNPCFIHEAVGLLIVVESNFSTTILTEHEIAVVIADGKLCSTAGAFDGTGHKSTSFLVGQGYHAGTHKSIKPGSIHG